MRLVLWAKQYNSSACAPRFFCTFPGHPQNDYHVNLPIPDPNNYVETWTHDDEFFFLFLNLDKVLKNSTPGKIAYIWKIEWVPNRRDKFERTQMYFLAAYLLPSSLGQAGGREGSFPPVCSSEWQGKRGLCWSDLKSAQHRLSIGSLSVQPLSNYKTATKNQKYPIS